MPCISKKTQDWLCKKAPIGKDGEESLQHIGDFAFLWNIFEGDYYQYLGLKRGGGFFQKIYNWSKASPIFFGQSASNAFQYFKDRYVANNVSAESRGPKLEGLGFNNSSITVMGCPQKKKQKVVEMVRSILQSAKADENRCKLFALLAIEYRFRNQWFHGNKKLAKAVEQKESFEKINKFLMEFMDNF